VCASEGVYGFRFFKNGEWVPVIVDDRIPCFTDRSIGNASGKSLPKKPDPARGRMMRPLYCRPGNTVDCWVTLLEKAFAKLHGGMRVATSLLLRRRWQVDLLPTACGVWYGCQVATVTSLAANRTRR